MNRPNSGGFTAAACLLITLGSAPSVFANCCLHYQTVTFSVPGATRTVPTSINSSGAVAGYYYQPMPLSPAGGFVRDPDGSITLFPAPSSPVYIDDAGVVAGSCGCYDGLRHGFVGNPKVANGIVLFDPPGSKDTYVTGINASGWVTGFFLDAHGNAHGFRYIGGTSYTIDYPGARATLAEAITSQGIVVGVYEDQNQNQHGFLCFLGCGSFDAPAGYGLASVASVNSSFAVAANVAGPGGGSGAVGDLLHGISTVFQYPGSSGTGATGINSSGVVIGNYSVGIATHAFWRYPNGLMVNVDPPGSNGNAVAYAINDAGAFTGTIGPEWSWLGFITFPEAPPPCCIVGP